MFKKIQYLFILLICIIGFISWGPVANSAIRPVINDIVPDVIVSAVGLVEGGASTFAFEVKTAGADTFQLPLESGGTYDFNIDWGDGSESDITVYNHADTNHSYAGAGTYNVVITGTITGWKFDNHADASLVYEISGWGNFALLPASGSTFSGCSNMTWAGSAVGGFDTTNVTSMYQMFRNCTAFNQSVSNFDTALVDNMYRVFSGCTTFNQSVSNFNTAKVTNMGYMFYNCPAFNQSVSNFNTAKVTAMNRMFSGCTAFNQSVSNFDTALVTNMSSMFSGCTLSTVNYDALITAFSADVQTIVANFDGGDSKYTLGGAVETAHDAWAAKGWIIEDGGGI